MLLRALIVLLLALNLGVALWWALRPPAAAPGVPDPPPGVPRLQLVEEASPEARATAAGVAAAEPQAPLADADGDPAADADADADARNAGRDPADADSPSGRSAEGRAEGADPSASVPARCLSLGPFDQAASLAAAREALQPRALHLREREVVSAPRGWRVMLPPHADRAAAQATAQKLGAAGFDDHFILAEGAEANAIALGRFSGEAAARRHVAALRAAGFAAQADPLGETSVRHWLDLAVGDGFDADAARTAAGAQRAEALDCAQLR
ncbi:SPOR domain-containing protein [Luteimonas sp. SJ-92]|uniref:SPOR domain-containing protein n=1 Tax=Luteimonas salinisoli TaxID=2752307 RepID=A0A853J9N2_9GAMM|nr:SPOR domain-containing protein [Luteimonas salinisoli]NZA25389.1 SPOR domain-containing protein [Luteimonas salinisoli]